MINYTTLTLWSERIIVWVFGPALVGLFGFYFMGLEHLMVFPLGLAAAGIVGLFVIYVWRFFVPWE